MTALVDGVVSSNTLVQPGSWVVIQPVSGASVLVEYTNGSANDITNSIAVWKEAFTVTRNSIFKNDDDLCDIYVRITATGAAGTFTVEGADMSLATRYIVRDYEKYQINSQYTALPAMTKEKFVWMDDFEGTWAIGDAGPADHWGSTAGTGTATEVATTVAASLCGEITLKSASDDGAITANLTTLTTIGLAYKANQGGLAMEARIKLSDISEAYLFVGFTDTIHSTREAPIFLVAGDIDSDATDACGVCYDVDGTTKQFFHGGVKNGTDTVPAYSGTAPVDATYFVVRVEVSAAGAVQGFINGKAIGVPVPNAVTITTALTPCIAVSSRSAAARILTVDYVWVQQNR